MAFPDIVLGPAWATARALRRLHQRRRKVKLTVHRAVGIVAVSKSGLELDNDNYYVTVTNASHDRDIEITHVWFDTNPPVHIDHADLPVRLRYSEQWQTWVGVSDVPAAPSKAFWLARCLLAPDDKVVKSRPRKNEPPFGRVPRS